MRLRLAALSFLLGSAITGVCWLTLQPSLIRLIDLARRPEGPAVVEGVARVRAFLPALLFLDLLLGGIFAFAVLQAAIGGPLRRTEEQFRQLRETHEKLVQAQTELVATERLATVGRLAAGVAHEVGNPLSGILGYLSLARTRAGGEARVTELLDRVEVEVQRIDRIVRSLLDLGRPATGRQEPVALRELVAGCAQLLAAGPGFEHVTVDCRIDEATLVRADPGPLSQIVLNLLINAAQAMQGRGSIRVESEVRDARVLMQVQDAGPGIPEEVLPRIFEPFFTTRAAGQGTGLGLAVSRHLAHAMGGEIFAENVTAGGARFTVRLPPA